MRVVHFASGFLVSLSLLGSVTAHEFKSGGLTIDHPSSRPTPPTAKAGYLSICNDGADADRSIGGSATVGAGSRFTSPQWRTASHGCAASKTEFSLNLGRL